MFESLLEQLKGKEVVSFDLFDTLLFRMVKKPTDIFYLVGQEQLKRSLIQEELSPGEFQIIRQEAERLLYLDKFKECENDVNRDPEYTLNEIYHYFPSFLHIPVNRLEELEVTLEVNNCYLNESMYEVLKACKKNGKRVFIISDMYLTKQQIQKLLLTIGIDIDKDLDGIYVSSEYRCSKKSGKLFQTFLKNENINPKFMLHIGDDFNADIMGAEKVGIASFHFSYKDNLPLSLYYEEMSGKKTPSQLYSLRLLSHYEGKTRNEKSFSYELGNLYFGPVLAVFTDWILRQAKKENRKQIYPLMREGELFEKLLINQIEFQSIEGLEVKNLYVSRSSVFLPSFKEFGKELFEECMKKPEHSVQNMFETLGIKEEIGEFFEWKNCFTKDLWKIQERDLESDIFDYLCRDSIKAKIDETIDNQRKLLLEYLSEFPVDKNFMTCDVGYGGTIPSRINRVIYDKYGNESIKHYFLFSLNYGKKNYFENTNLKGMFGTIGDNGEAIEKVSLYTNLFEGYFMSDVGSTIGYQYNQEGCVVPVLDKMLIAQSELDKRLAFHRGVLDFQNQYLRLCAQKNGKMLFEDIWEYGRQDLLHILQRIFELPTEKEAAELLKTTYEQNDGSSYVWDYYRKEHIEECKKLGVRVFLQENRKRRYHPNQEVYWAQGIASICEPQYFITQCAGDGRYGYFADCIKVCEHLRKEAATEAVIYGAGEVGKEMKGVLDIYGIKVNCFVDQNSALWERSIEGVCVKPISYISEQTSKLPIIIASFRFVREIEENLKKICKENQIYKMKED